MVFEAIKFAMLLKTDNPSAGVEYLSTALMQARTKKEKSDIVNNNIMSTTPLHMAVKSGNIEAIRLLLANGAKATIPDYMGEIPLHMAVKSGNIEAIMCLLDNGAKESINIPDENGRTSLHMAASSGNSEAIMCLLDNGAKESINIPAEGGITPLHMAARSGNSEAIMCLLDNGAKESINIPAEGGITPLHMAAKSGNSEAMKLLLDNGADANARNDRDETALMMAQDEVPEALRRGGALEHDVKIDDNVLATLANYKQNVHSTALNEGVRESISKIRAHFKLPETEYKDDEAVWKDGSPATKIPDWVAPKVEEFKNYLESSQAKDDIALLELPGDEKYADLSNEDKAKIDKRINDAKRCLYDNIEIISTYRNYRDGKTNCSMLEEIGLSWLVANEEGHPYTGVGEMGIFSCAQKKAKLIVGLADAATAYPPGIGFGYKRGQSCEGGTFNNIIGGMSKTHECVYAEMLTQKQAEALQSSRSFFDKRVEQISRLLPLMLWDRVLQDKKLEQYVGDAEDLTMAWPRIREQAYGFASKTDPEEIKQGQAHQRILGDCKGWMLDNFEPHTGEKPTPQDMLILEKLLETTEIVPGILIDRHKEALAKAVMKEMSLQEREVLVDKWASYRKSSRRSSFDSTRDTPEEVKEFFKRCKSYIEAHASEIFRENELLMSRPIQEHDKACLLEVVRDNISTEVIQIINEQLKPKTQELSVYQQAQNLAQGLQKHAVEGSSSSVSHINPQEEKKAGRGI